MLSGTCTSIVVRHQCSGTNAVSEEISGFDKGECHAPSNMV